MLEFFSGLLVAAIGSAVAVGLYLVQRSRTQLGWQILSASTIIPRLRNPMPNIHIAVKPKLLGLEGEELIPISDDILGFRIRIRNTGTEVIDKQLVTLTMSENAKVLSIEPESQPDFGGMQINTAVQDPTPNIATATLPYLNPKQEVIFSLQCLGDLETKCRVSAGAPGLTLQDIEWRQRVRWLCIMTGVASLAILILGIARLLVETGDIPERDRDNIDNILLIAGLVGGLLIVVAILNLFSLRVQSPKDHEKTGSSRRAGRT